MECENDVEAIGECVGSGGQSTVRDEDSIVTPIVCAADNCPRTPGWWGQQCAQKGGGSTKLTAAQVTAIAECIDARSDFFDWSNDFDSFCRTINPGKMDQRKQAKRQFIALNRLPDLSRKVDQLEERLRLLESRLPQDSTINPAPA